MLFGFALLDTLQMLSSKLPKSHFEATATGSGAGYQALLNQREQSFQPTGSLHIPSLPHPRATLFSPRLAGRSLLVWDSWAESPVGSCCIAAPSYPSGPSLVKVPGCPLVLDSAHL